MTMETRKTLNKVNTMELVSMALLSAILLIGQVSMSYLPNIEIVSLLVYIYIHRFTARRHFLSSMYLYSWRAASMVSACGGSAIYTYGVF